MSTEVDLVAIGRVSVDLYGQQVGGRLEDVSTFAKGVGGCPANVAIGAARLGLRSALISRVGDEPMGRFVLEELAREGVDARAVRIDPQRLTALVLLGVHDPDTFPLIFYRENCADSALGEDDIDPDLIGASQAVLVTGTHFSIAAAARAQRRAIALAKAHGARVILDIDCRPNLWGIGGHGAGESRYARSARVTHELAGVLADCDLVVGTEEELHVAAGLEDTLAAVRHVRSLTRAVIVCKRGPKGCIVFDGPTPETLEQGLVAAGERIEVYNVLGAGDAFLAGFLSGYLRGAPHEESARRANACGALAVSRLLCSSEFPTTEELEHYLAHGSAHPALREDARLNHLHWVTTRPHQPPMLAALALDHGASPAEGATPEQRAQLAALAIEAVERVASGREGFGMRLDGIDGAALRQATDARLWVARAIERAGPGPLDFEQAPSLAVHLNGWPATLTVSCRCRYHPDDPRALREAQERELVRVATACRAQQRQLLLGIGAGEPGKTRRDTAAPVMARLYELGIYPDWWELEPQPGSGAWQSCAQLIARHDPHCRGVLLGLQSPAADARGALALAGQAPIVRGFMVGGSIFAGAAQAWLAGQISAEAATEEIAQRFRACVAAWVFARDPQHQLHRSWP